MNSQPACAAGLVGTVLRGSYPDSQGVYSGDGDCRRRVVLRHCLCCGGAGFLGFFRICYELPLQLLEPSRIAHSRWGCLQQCIHLIHSTGVHGCLNGWRYFGSRDVSIAEQAHWRFCRCGFGISLCLQARSNFPCARLRHLVGKRSYDRQVLLGGDALASLLRMGFRFGLMHFFGSGCSSCFGLGLGCLCGKISRHIRIRFSLCPSNSVGLCSSLRLHLSPLGSIACLLGAQPTLTRLFRRLLQIVRGARSRRRSGRLGSCRCNLLGQGHRAGSSGRRRCFIA
mmetsp:Transcript_33329/g.87734  ORF Transcript_33329/g.87734 Transcript_33329/m.87734 type:complete len:283 (+) Transcript_33329:112-960(+)